MSSWFQLLLILNVSLLILNCGLDIEDPTPPLPPVWVEKSLPEEWPERGIDAHESGGIYLEWEPNPEEDIVVYNIYRATWFEVNDSLGEYSLLTRIKIEPLLKTEFVDRNVQQRARYYYKLKSQDASDNLSDYSDSTCYSPMSRIRVDSMNPNGLTELLNENRIFSWIYLYSIEMENYNFTILSEYDELIVRITISPSDYTGSGEEWQLPANISLHSGGNYKWRIDTGSQYVDGRETCGSESPWAPFLYLGD